MPTTKLSAIRVMQANGNYGEEIPIGASAQNVFYNEADNIAVSDELKRVLNDKIGVKPQYIGIKEGFSAQAIAYIGSEIYAIGFGINTQPNQYVIPTINGKYDNGQTANGANDSCIVLYNSATREVISWGYGNFGHISSMMCSKHDDFSYDMSSQIWEGNFTLCIAKNATTIIQATFSVSGIQTIPSASEEWSFSNCSFWNIMSYHNDLYFFGKRDNVFGIHKFVNNDGKPELPSTDNEAVPMSSFTVNSQLLEANYTYGRPRVPQACAIDEDYMYYAFSNPNTLMVFDNKTGKFVKYLDIGDFAGSEMMIGEIEMIAFGEVPGQAKLISQYYYLNSDTEERSHTRYWLLSSIRPNQKFASYPIDCSHTYPTEERVIYTKLASDGTKTITNNADSKYSKTYSTANLSSLPWRELTLNPDSTNEINLYVPSTHLGSESNPYPSLETALFAAAATPNNTIKIHIIEGGTHTAGLFIKFPFQDLTIIADKCNVRFNGKVQIESGNVTFDFIKDDNKGHFTFAQINTFCNTKISLNRCTFSSKALISSSAPYTFSGEVYIIEGYYLGYTNETLSTVKVFKFQEGSSGAAAFNLSSSTAPPYCEVIKGSSVSLQNVSNINEWYTLTWKIGATSSEVPTGTPSDPFSSWSQVINRAISLSQNYNVEIDIIPSGNTQVLQRIKDTYTSPTTIRPRHSITVKCSNENVKLLFDELHIPVGFFEIRGSKNEQNITIKELKTGERSHVTIKNCILSGSAKTKLPVDSSEQAKWANFPYVFRGITSIMNCAFTGTNGTSNTEYSAFHFYDGAMGAATFCQAAVTPLTEDGTGVKKDTATTGQEPTIYKRDLYYTNVKISGVKIVPEDPIPEIPQKWITLFSSDGNSDQVKIGYPIPINSTLAKKWIKSEKTYKVVWTSRQNASPVTYVTSTFTVTQLDDKVGTKTDTGATVISDGYQYLQQLFFITPNSFRTLNLRFYFDSNDPLIQIQSIREMNFSTTPTFATLEYNASNTQILSGIGANSQYLIRSIEVLNDDEI